MCVSCYSYNIYTCDYCFHISSWWNTFPMSSIYTLHIYNGSCNMYTVDSYCCCLDSLRFPCTRLKVLPSAGRLRPCLLLWFEWRGRSMLLHWEQCIIKCHPFFSLFCLLRNTILLPFTLCVSWPSTCIWVDHIIYKFSRYKYNNISCNLPSLTLNLS